MPGPGTFRKRPIEVEALQWTGDNLPEMRSFAGDNFEVRVDPGEHYPEATGRVFDHLHRTWIFVQTHDWVVRDGHGAFYPVRDAVFKEIYEKVVEAAPVAGELAHVRRIRSEA
jgi:hypothetical protein